VEKLNFCDENYFGNISVIVRKRNYIVDEI